MDVVFGIATGISIEKERLQCMGRNNRRHHSTTWKFDFKIAEKAHKAKIMTIITA